MRARRLLTIVAILATAFVGGLVSSLIIEQEAHAKVQTQTATVYIPPQGLTFRALDGRVIARLSYDVRGGVFEVYGQRDRPSASLRPVSPPAAVPLEVVASLPEPIDLGF
jgi:hypothetical protein